MKIAVPVNDAGNLDSHFGHCRYFAIHETDGMETLSDELITPPPHEPGILPQWLAEQKVTHVLAAGMGNRARRLFDKLQIKVFTGAPEIQVKDLIRDFKNHSVQFTDNRCSH